MLVRPEVVEARHLEVFVGGSFGIHIDLPKQEDSEVTMEARLTGS